MRFPSQATPSPPAPKLTARTSRKPSIRRPAKRSSSSPSSSLFSFFATIASSAVHARPLDPEQDKSLPFLYPFLPHDIHPQQPSTTASSRSPSKRLQRRASVPDKYVQGDDGLWRKTAEWSLYGSTICSGSSCSAEATPTTVNDESSNASADALSVSSLTTTATATATATATVSSSSTDSSVTSLSSSVFDLSTLPTGWANNGGASHDLTAVILPLSLVLAGSIVALILACVVWRRKRLKDKKDLERVPRNKAREDEKSDDGSESSSIQQAKTAQRKWAKATSRWKANIRQSARRRRTNRTLSSTTLIQDNQSTPSVQTPPQNDDSVSVLRSPSRVSSRHSHDGTPHPPPAPPPVSPRLRSSIDIPHVLPHTSDVPVTPSSVDPPLRPPAYGSPLDTTPPSDIIPSYHPGPSNAIPSSSKLPSAPPPIDTYGNDEAVHVSPGHVATDDKAILARRAAMASAPPDEGTSASLPHPPLAPALEDDDDIPADVLATSDPIPPYPALHPDLPPPSSLAKVAASRYEQYTLSFDHTMGFIDAGSEEGPSIPPFEEVQSYAGVVAPSAPPAEEGLFPDEALAPSAPPLWEDADTDVHGVIGVAVEPGVMESIESSRRALSSISESRNCRHSPSRGLGSYAPPFSLSVDADTDADADTLTIPETDQYLPSYTSHLSP